jgi:SPP1 family predicted phage head-tail adaptor
MRAGRLDRKIDIQRQTASQSPSGEPIESWTDIVKSWSASVRPLRGDERYSVPQEVASEQIQFEVRYSTVLADLTPKDRIIYPALGEGEESSGRRICDILAINEIGRRKGLQIVAQKRSDTD